MKKVMIGLPTFNGACPEALENFMLLAFHLGRREPDYEFFLKVVGGREQFRARNNLVNMAIQTGMDYLWMLDGDNVVPNDAFSRLMAHGKDIIGGLYLQKQSPYRAVMMRESKMVRGHYEWIDQYDDGLIEVDVLGGGCMLIKVSLLEKIKEPYFVPETERGTDVQICEKARALGKKVYVDTTVEIGHLTPPAVIYPSNVPKEARTTGRYLDPERVRAYGKECGTLRDDVREFLKLSAYDYDVELRKALDAHVPLWNKKKRDSEESVNSFYQKYDRLNVIRLSHYITTSEWATYNNPDFMSPGWSEGLDIKFVLDYGCGLSILALPFIRQGLEVASVDLPDTMQLEFLRWRRDKHKVSPLSWFIMDTDECLYGGSEFDCIMLWDVIEHLYDPWGTIDKLVERLSSHGCIMTNLHLCNFVTNELCPQHIMRLDKKTFLADMKKRYGLVQDTKRPYLLRRI